MPTFSERNGFVQNPDILFRYDAPENLRHAVLSSLRSVLGSYDAVRNIVCEILVVSPDRGNWSEIPNIRDETESHLQECDWYYIYDIIETVGKNLITNYQTEQFSEYQNQINRIF